MGIVGRVKGSGDHEDESLMELEEILLHRHRKLVVDVVGCGGMEDRRKEVNYNYEEDEEEEEEEEEKVVCVTNGVSFLGLAIVNHLLLRRYSVRILLENPEDIEKLRTRNNNNNNNGNDSVEKNKVRAVTAKLTDVESLMEAFNGCRGVFHTSSFIDPAGLTGYSKSMVEVEMKRSENVIEACARTSSVTKCVLTSSLLAGIWRQEHEQQQQESPQLSPLIVDHNSWSDESLCLDKKLWYALGKIRAEKAAWKIAKEKGLKLATICPGLITGPDFCTRNPTATIAYLKGAQEMYDSGLLATSDVNKLAEAHVTVYRAMKQNAYGRYICFDRVIQTEDDVEKLAEEMGISKTKLCPNPSTSIGSSSRFQLSDRKLSNLMSASARVHCSYNKL